LAGDLLGRCGDLVGTANEIINGPGPGTGNSLGMTAEETNQALSKIAHMQQPSVGRSASEIAAVHTATVGDRLYALREGATGLQIAGNLVDRDGRAMELAYALFSEDSAAGSDSGLVKGLGAFLNFRGNFGDREGNTEEIAFDYYNVGVTLGADYRFSDLLVAGLALGYTYGKRTFAFDRGELTGNSIAVSGYVGFQSRGIYVDGIYTYSYHGLDTQRRILYGIGSARPVDRTTSSDTSANEHALGANLGYQAERKGFSFGPVTRLEWRHLGIDPFTERGAAGLVLSYNEDTVQSLIYNLGADVSYAASTRFGVVSPYVGMEWAHQFLDDPRNITARYAFDPTFTNFFVRSTAPDRDYANLRMGVSGAFQSGISAFIDYEVILFHNVLTANSFTGGIRMEF
jgi:outer membrane autotransporter protein